MLRNYDSTNGLIFTTEFNVEDTESLQAGLGNKYNVSQVQQAFWMKSKNEKLTPFLIKFAQSKVPDYISIPGQQNIKVYPYLPRLLFCGKFLLYTHRAKNCQNRERCSKCGEEHKVTECNQSIPKCFRCGGEHRAGSRDCKKQKEDEISEFKVKRKLAGARPGKSTIWTMQREAKPMRK